MTRHQTLTADEVKALARSLWTEAEFTEAVIALARENGFKAVHFRPARVMRGGVWKYETPIAGDGKGWVDVHLSKPLKRGERRRAVLYRELKSETGRLSPEQILWRDWLLACGEDWKCWRPKDWNEIVEELSR